MWNFHSSRQAGIRIPKYCEGAIPVRGLVSGGFKVSWMLGSPVGATIVLDW